MRIRWLLFHGKLLPPGHFNVYLPNMFVSNKASSRSFALTTLASRNLFNLKVSSWRSLIRSSARLITSIICAISGSSRCLRWEKGIERWDNAFAPKGTPRILHSFDSFVCNPFQQFIHVVLMKCIRQKKISNETLYLPIFKVEKQIYHITAWAILVYGGNPTFFAATWCSSFASAHLQDKNNL